MASEDLSQTLRHRGHMLRRDAHERDAHKYLEILDWATLFIATYGHAIQTELNNPGGINQDRISRLIKRKEDWQDTAIFAEENHATHVSQARQEGLAAIGEHEYEEYDDWPCG